MFLLPFNCIGYPFFVPRAPIVVHHSHEVNKQISENTNCDKSYRMRNGNDGYITSSEIDLLMPLLIIPITASILYYMSMQSKKVK